MTNKSDIQKTLVVMGMIIAIAIVIIVALFLGVKALNNNNPNALAGTNKIQDTYSISNGLTNLVNRDFSENPILKPIGYIITYGTRYIFGIDYDGEGSDSEIVVLIATWFIFFLVLADFIEIFGMMNKTTSKLIGALITLAMANLGVFYGILTALMAGFAFLAGLSVIAALFSMIFFAFIAHMGVNALGQWMMDRKAMLEASKMKAGGTMTAGAIAGLKLAGQALKEAGE